MKETKFRAWDKEKGRMRGIVSMSKGIDNQGVSGWFVTLDNWRPVMPEDQFQGHPEVVAISDQYRLTPSQHELMQYTGLKDSKVVEIYEGDIVKGRSTQAPISVESIIWGSVKYDGGLYFVGSMPIYSLCVMEVIGNLFENPELLEVTNAGD